jgi:hypothetical protein
VIDGTFSAITSGWTLGPSNNVTLNSNGSMVLSKTSDYLVTADIGGFANTASIPIRLAVFANNLEQTLLESQTNAQTGTSYFVSLSSMANLTANSLLDLRVATFGTRSINIDQCHFNIISLS